MKLSTFQKKAATTAVYPKPNMNERYTKIYASEEAQDAGKIIPIMYCALGLAGEAGEVADEVKKSWRNDMKVTDERLLKIKDEIGDTLWYAAQLSTELGLDLEDIAQRTLDKLQQRQKSSTLKEHS